LKQLFENKEYGIVSNSGFTINHKDGEETRNEIPILGMTSHKSQQTET